VGDTTPRARKPLRLAFMGSPDFAVPALQALHAAGHDIRAVYTQPPKPAGRGQQETPCPVHRAALALGLEVRTPARVKRDAGAHAAFAALDLDVAVVAAYGLILPPAMLEAPRRGCLNIHASLLPRWRGAAPIHAAILHGDAESGVTIMRMEEGLDTGPMLLREAVPLNARSTTPELHDALAAIGARLILRALDEAPPETPQPERGVTYAAKLSKADGLLDWSQPAAALDARVRAMNPWPGAYFPHAGEMLRVLAAEPAGGAGAPGTVLAGPGLVVACGSGALRLTRLQRPGRAAMDADALLRGYAMPAGTKLG
jgi:methionyl-tRNA formyltransferase